MCARPTVPAPAGRARGHGMKSVSFVVAAFAVITGVAPYVAKAETLPVQDCTARKATGELNTRVKMISCLNDVMTVQMQADGAANLAPAYRFEAAALQAASDADAGRITQDEYAARLKVAELLLQSEAAAIDQAQQQQDQQRQEAVDDRNREAAQAAQYAQQKRRAAVAGMLLRNNQAQPYQLPALPPLPVPTIPQPQPFNCTTNRIGETAFTNCR